MTDDELKTLDIGDVVRHRSDPLRGYIVAANYGNRVTAVRTVDLTNPQEWLLDVKTTGRDSRM